MDSMRKTHLKYFFTVFFILTGGIAMYCSMVSPGDTASLGDAEIDDMLRKIGIKFIRQTIEDSDNIEEAAEALGIAPEELKRLCTALKIAAPWAPGQMEPIPLPSEEMLADDSYEPDVILRYEGLSPYIILVDKSSHKLYLLRYSEGKRTAVMSFECKTGKNHGDKKKEGDNRTPEGVFFFINKYSRSDILKLVGKDNAYQYGDMAFVTNFPNSIDRMHGKNGGGIWLHGTDRPFNETSPNDTRGCIVVTNEDINTLSGYIELYTTPIVIVHELNMLSKRRTEEESAEILEVLERWRAAWENQRIEEYRTFYSSIFHSQNMNRARWLERKKNIFRLYDINYIVLKNFSIFRHNSGLVVQFIQDYSADNIKKNIGIKTLYLIPEGESWGIITEHFRKI